MLCYGDGNLYAYESGAQAAALGAYGAGDILAVTYDGTAVKGGGYPGTNVVQDWAEQSCYAAFEEFVGVEWTASSFDIETWWPSAESWGQKDRKVICVSQSYPWGMLKEGDDVSVMIINVDRKMRSIQLSIKQKDNADAQQGMQALRQSSERENAGTTSLGALLRAKLDNKSE